MSNIKILAGDTIVYGLGQTLKKVIGLILLPFYTRVLSPGEYGVLDSMATLVYFLVVILGLGIDGATGRYFFIAETETEKKKLLYTSLIIRSVSNFIPIVLILPFSKTISFFLFKTVDYTWVVTISLLLIPITNLNTLQEAIFRYYRKPWKFLWVTVARAASTPSLGILFVLVLQWGVFGANLATLLSSVIVSVVAYFTYTHKSYLYEFSWYWAKKMLKFGYPLIFLGIMLWVNNVSDRFFLLHYTSLEQIGLYSIGNTFSEPILLLNLALSMSTTVLVMSIYSEEKEDINKPRTKAFLTTIWHIYLWLGITIALFLSIFSYEIVSFITTPEYVSGILVIPFISFSYLLYHSSQITGSGMSLEEKSTPYFWIMLIAASTNALLNFYFVPKYGFIGASITTLISNFIYFAIAYFWSQKVFYIKRNLIKPMLYFFSCFSIAVFFPFAQIKFNVELSLWLKTVIFLGSIFLPFAFNLFSMKAVFNSLKSIKESHVSKNS